MDWARAMEFKTLKVQLRAVPLVPGKAVGGVLGIQAQHDAVARHLRQDAGGGDAFGLSIAAHDGGVRDGKGADGQSIDEGVLGQLRQGLEGAAHGLMGGAQDIDAVDLRVLHHGDCPADGCGGNQGVMDCLPLCGGEFFGVVQQGVPEALREDDGGCHHGAGERAAASLVYAGDGADAGLAQCILKPERAAHGLGPVCGLFPDSHRLLALAVAQVVEL